MKFLFYEKQKSKKVFSKLTLGNTEFAKCEIQHFHQSDEVRIYQIFG